MKRLDKLIRAWRTHTAIKHIPPNTHSVFDIGCGDGYLLTKISAEQRHGCDPLLKENLCQDGCELLKDSFPKIIISKKNVAHYDAVFALAVFEHMAIEKIEESASVIKSMLTQNGRLIVTIPQPFVDHILLVLLKLRLIEGQALDEHYGADPNEIVKAISIHLTLTKRKRFQFGLNNIFIFEKKI